LTTRENNQKIQEMSPMMDLTKTGTWTQKHGLAAKLLMLRDLRSFGYGSKLGTPIIGWLILN
jgi:hypothetical protein